jgi:hypothetical protein
VGSRSRILLLFGIGTKQAMEDGDAAFETQKGPCDVSIFFLLILWVPPLLLVKGDWDWARVR